MTSRTSPENLSDDELADRIRLYSERYSIRHRGGMFGTYASLVLELLDRRETVGRFTEFAPVLPNGLVLDNLADYDPTNLPPRMAVAQRTVTPWEYDNETLV